MLYLTDTCINDTDITKLAHDLNIGDNIIVGAKIQDTIIPFITSVIKTITRPLWLEIEVDTKDIPYEVPSIILCDYKTPLSIIQK